MQLQPTQVPVEMRPAHASAAPGILAAALELKSSSGTEGNVLAPSSSTRDRVAFLKRLAASSERFVELSRHVEDLEEELSLGGEAAVLRSRAGAESAFSRSSTELSPVGAVLYRSPRLWTTAWLTAHLFSCGRASRFGYAAVHDRLVTVSRTRNDANDRQTEWCRKWCGCDPCSSCGVLFALCCRRRQQQRRQSLCGGVGVDGSAPVPLHARFISAFHLQDSDREVFNGRAVHLRVAFSAGITVLIGLLLLAITAYVSSVIGPSSKLWFIWTAVESFFTAIFDRFNRPGDHVTASYTVIFLSWVTGGALVLLSARRLGYARLLELRPGSVAAVLRLVLRPTEPFAMVSYPWMPGILHTARSLAFALPDAWCDVRWLASGVHVPSVTAEVAKRTHALICCMNGLYLNRAACVIEFVAAILHRSDASQVTLVYATNDVEPRAIAIMRAAGLVVFTEGQELQMLRWLDEHVYRATSGEDVARTLRWFQRHAEAVHQVDRKLYLPSTQLRTAQRWALRLCGRVTRPAGSLIAGAAFLSPDALQVGRSMAIRDEQLLLAATLILNLASFVLFGLGCTDTTLACPISVKFIAPFLCCGISIIVFVLAAVMRVNWDARNKHSSMLLPLKVAATIGDRTWMPSVAARSKTRRGRSTSGGDTPATGTATAPGVSVASGLADKDGFSAAGGLPVSPGAAFAAASVVANPMQMAAAGLAATATAATATATADSEVASAAGSRQPLHITVGVGDSGDGADDGANIHLAAYVSPRPGLSPSTPGSELSAVRRTEGFKRNDSSAGGAGAGSSGPQLASRIDAVRAARGFCVYFVRWSAAARASWRRPASAAPPDGQLDRRIGNVCAFLRELGVHADTIVVPPGDAPVSDRAAAIRAASGEHHPHLPAGAAIASDSSSGGGSGGGSNSGGSSGSRSGGAGHALRQFLHDEAEASIATATAIAAGVLPAEAAAAGAAAAAAALLARAPGPAAAAGAPAAPVASGTAAVPFPPGIVLPAGTPQFSSYQSDGAPSSTAPSREASGAFSGEAGAFGAGASRSGPSSPAASTGAAVGPAGTASATRSLTNPAVFVFVLDCPRAAEAWLNHLSDFWPTERSVLLVDWDATDVDATTPRLHRSLRSFMLLTLGAKNGISPMCPYEGFAHAVIDAIASKVGKALVASN